MKKKVLSMLITFAMLLSMLPATALAVENDDGPDMSGDIINVDARNAQDVLDGKYGDITGKTINFTEDIAEVLDLARPTRYEGSGTEYYNYVNSQLEKDPTEWSEDISSVMNSHSRYYRTLEDVTFTAEDSVTVAGFTFSAGHVASSGHDYVRDVEQTAGVTYYKHSSLENISFEGLTITGQFVAQLYMADCAVEEITFDGCTFTGTTDDGENAAIKFLADNQYFTDITVKDCEISNYYQGVYIQGVDGAEIVNNSISNTDHNAIALQSYTVAAKGTIDVAENYIFNVHDRAIRLNAVSGDAEISVNNNIMVNCGDENGQLIKAGEVESGAEIDLESNYWDGKDVSTAVDGLTVPTNIGINGGTWDVNVEDYLMEGAGLIDNGDGTYSVDPVVLGLKGAGTAADPYLISDLDELKWFRDAVNGGDNYDNKYVELAADIDLDGEEWTPIGVATYTTNNYAPAEGSKVFCGEFDGNGKTLSNLKVTKDIEGSDPDEDANLGLFGITGEGAVIKDLTITNVDISTTGRNVGALAGFAYKATLDNITIDGDINISGGNNVAGVCGMTRYHDMSATNITVSGEDGSLINGNNIVGGIFAEIAPNGSTQTFSNLSVENIEIKGVGGVGGIVGLLTNGSMSDVSVENVALTGKTEWNGAPMGRIRMGSVVGLLGGSGPSTVSGVTVEGVTGKNLTGETVTLPVVGANYTGSIGNATEAKVGDDYYATLAIALSKAESGDTITLLADVDVTGSITISDELTIDLNGHTLTGTDTATGSFGLINIQPGAELTINDSSEDGSGAITLVATNNREWNAYSSVISNQRGKLTVNGGTIEHLGGTDMAYGIDNLTNGTGTYAETIVNGGTVKSTYRAIRQFLNGTEAQNILTVNGGTIEGANKSIWMQDPSTNANSGTLTVSDEATLVGDVYLFVTSGSTEWPVSVSIADDAFADGYTVMTANVPVGTKVDVVGGYWGISDANTSYVAAIKGVSYTTLQAAIDAAKPGDTVTLLSNVELTEALVVSAETTVTLDLNGKTISMSDSSSATAYAVKNSGNLTIKDSVGEGRITFNTTTPSADNAYASNAVSNYGTLTVESGVIENTSTGGACYALDNYAGSTATINGGKLTAAKTTVRIFNWTNGDAAKATLNVTGGEIVSADGYGINLNMGNTPAAALNISGGTITTNDTDYNLAVYVVNKESAENLTIGVTGGTFNGNFALNGLTSTTMKEGAVSISGGTFEGVVCYAEPTYGFITGGTFSAEPDESYIVKGKKATKDDAVYIIIPANSFKVTFDANGGNTVDSKYTHELTSGLPTPTRTGSYRFDGWYLDNGTKVTSVSEIPAGDVTLTAKWTYTGGGGGGGGGSTSYTITVEDPKNGDITVSPKSASSGTTVTITVDPDNGYELDELAVLDKNGKEVELTKKSDTKYTFKMPSGKVTIEATFAEIEEYENPFVDVAEGAYYYDAVLWAAENGITGGTSATTFSPAVTCTRAQTVTFLWRAAGSPEPETTVCPFEDVTADKYYYDAVLWAVENGITVGTSATTFSPNATVTRAQNVTFLWRWAESPAVEAANPFADVASDMYYHDAVLWAAEEGITAGITATTFSPNDPCLRSQIVTFLYRYLAE